MSRLSNDGLGLSFEVPDRFTVREQLEFRGRIAGTAGEIALIRYWQAALSIITDWQCELVPDPAALDMDTETDVRIADIVQWTANAVAGHMAGIDTPPKK